MTDKARANWQPGMPEVNPSHGPVDPEELKVLPQKNPHQAFIIGAPFRAGFSSFMMEVEYTMYEPDTAKNAELELILTKFPSDSELIWATLIVPMRDLETIRKVAEKYNFTLKPNLVILELGPKGEEVFPINTGDNVFAVQGGLTDENEVAALRAHWDDVMEKHAAGIPWKV